MQAQLEALRKLVEAADPELSAFLEARDSSIYLVTYRWLLVHFKREFSFDEVHICAWHLCYVPSMWISHLNDRLVQPICFLVACVPPSCNSSTLMRDDVSREAKGFSTAGLCVTGDTAGGHREMV